MINKRILMAILIIVVIFTASGIMAFDPGINRHHVLNGTLRWTRCNLCNSPDFVSSPDRDNVYLIGKGFPSKGQYQGCRIHAHGTYFREGFCNYFSIDKMRIYCSPALMER